MGQILAFDELHNERAAFKAVDLRDVRMIQRGEGLRLALEPRKAVAVARESVRQHLNRDVASEPGIPRAVDFTHAALSNGAEDFVGAETSSGEDWHGRGRLYSPAAPRAIRGRSPWINARSCWARPPRLLNATRLCAWQAAAVGLGSVDDSVRRNGFTA